MRHLCGNQQISQYLVWNSNNSLTKKLNSQFSRPFVYVSPRTLHYSFPHLQARTSKWKTVEDPRPRKDWWRVFRKHVLPCHGCLAVNLLNDGDLVQICLPLSRKNGQLRGVGSRGEWNDVFTLSIEDIPDRWQVGGWDRSRLVRKSLNSLRLNLFSFFPARKFMWKLLQNTEDAKYLLWIKNENLTVHSVQNLSR